MNAKRIAAIIGLIGIFASLILLVLSAVLPAYKDALQSLSGIGFLLAACIAGIFWLRSRKKNEPDSEEDAE